MNSELAADLLRIKLGAYANGIGEYVEWDDSLVELYLEQGYQCIEIPWYVSEEEAYTAAFDQLAVVVHHPSIMVSNEAFNNADTSQYERTIKLLAASLVIALWGLVLHAPHVIQDAQAEIPYSSDNSKQVAIVDISPPIPCSEMEVTVMAPYIDDIPETPNYTQPGDILYVDSFPFVFNTRGYRQVCGDDAAVAEQAFVKGNQEHPFTPGESVELRLTNNRPEFFQLTPYGARKILDSESTHSIRKLLESNGSKYGLLVRGTMYTGYDGQRYLGFIDPNSNAIIGLSALDFINGTELPEEFTPRAKQGDYIHFDTKISISQEMRTKIREVWGADSLAILEHDSAQLEKMHNFRTSSILVYDEDYPDTNHRRGIAYIDEGTASLSVDSMASENFMTFWRIYMHELMHMKGESAPWILPRDQWMQISDDEFIIGQQKGMSLLVWNARYNTIVFNTAVHAMNEAFTDLETWILLIRLGKDPEIARQAMDYIPHYSRSARFIQRLGIPPQQDRFAYFAELQKRYGNEGDTFSAEDLGVFIQELVLSQTEDIDASVARMQSKLSQ